MYSGGSGTVLLNVNAKHHIYNDINNYVAEILKGMLSQSPDDTISQIEDIIGEYGLSKTNEEGFLRLREDYNNGLNDWVHLYTLMCYSFNYQFRFNSKHKYNSSFGRNRSQFSGRQKANIRQICDLGLNIDFRSRHFADIDFSDFAENDLVYIDSPYLDSVGNYNDGKRGFEGWNEKHEIQLLQILDELSMRGGGSH